MTCRIDAAAWNDAPTTLAAKPATTARKIDARQCRRHALRTSMVIAFIPGIRPQSGRDLRGPEACQPLADGAASLTIVHADYNEPVERGGARYGTLSEWWPSSRIPTNCGVRGSGGSTWRVLGSAMSISAESRSSTRSLSGASLSGIIDGLRINDVEVAPLIDAELDRLYPDRLRVRHIKDPDGLRDAWALVQGLWAATVDRARRLPESALHQRVDEEWSFIETLRHLVFATDAWVYRPILGEARPFHPFGVPHAVLDDPAALGIDVGAEPSFEEVLGGPRAERTGVVGRIIEELTPEGFDRTCAQNPVAGYPAETTFPVGICLGIVIEEEWEHHRYAVRDLAVLEAPTQLA